MKLFAALLAASVLFAPAAPASAAQKKPLIVFFSWGGSTRAIAAEAARLTGAETFQVVPAKLYPSGYNETVDIAKKEQADNARPALKELKAPRLADYDTVIIATPNWWGSLPMPVMTFLDANDLSGKKVLQIVSNGGGGVQRCAADLKKAAPKASFTEPYVVTGSRTAGLAQWLAKNGLVKK